MEQKPHPLSDLSFFRFPETTMETAASIMILFFLLGLAVLLTVLVQRLIHERNALREHRNVFSRVSGESRMQNDVREALEQLVQLTRYKHGSDLIRDAEAYERAVHTKIAADPAADPGALAAIRRAFHLNVMNPDIQLVATRQLTQDLPIRLIAKDGDETLDIYCGLLEVNESYFLLDVPLQEDVRAFLAKRPETQMIFWREDLGETVFPIELGITGSGDLTFFRAEHVFRSEDASARSDFRLTLDFPLTYRYMEREKLAKLKSKPDQDHGLRTGEGHLIDMSYGGAAFATKESLPLRGLAQLHFTIHDQPVHMMLEVISHAHMQDGRWRHHGQFRGMSQDIKNRVYNYLSREQAVRLREKEAFRKG